LTSEELGQLFVLLVSMSNETVGKVILNVPEIPKDFMKKAVDACREIINMDKFDVNAAIVAEGKENYPLQITAVLGTPDLVTMLIKKGADVNLRVGGYPLVLSLLSFASEKSLPDVYQMAFGFKPSNPNALARHYLEILKVFIKNGADTTITDPNSNLTFLQIAQSLGLDEIVDMVMNKKRV